MAVGAWDFFALIWNHPIISCLVLLLFTPALFPIVVYFSPLLISTALCAIALISMNMADSPETEDDPYLRRWQSEQVETEQSKPARQSWSQWVTKVEEKARVWVDSRFTKGNQAQDDKFKWKVIHDNDDENEVLVPSEPLIFPLAGKPTKIKYGTQTEDEDRDADDAPNRSPGGRVPSSTTNAEKEEEILSVSNANVQPIAASSVQPQKANEITRALATEEVVDTSTTKVPIATLSKTEEKPASPGLHALAEAIQRTPATTSIQKAGIKSLDNPSTTPPLAETREEPEQRGDGSFEAHTISGEGVPQPVVQDHASHAPPSLEIAGLVPGQSPSVAWVQHAATLGIANTSLTMSKSSSSHDTESLISSTARSIPNNLSQPATLVANATPAAQLPLSDQISPDQAKAQTSRSLPSNFVSTQAKVDIEPEAPTVSDSPVVGNPIRSPVQMHLPSMNERVAEARMRKPEPTAYSVMTSGDAGDTETDAQLLDAQESVAEQCPAVGWKNGEQPIASSGLGESEIDRPSSGKVWAETQLSESGVKGLTKISAKGTSSFVPADSLDENEVGDRSTEFEKVIFVDESSKLGSSTVSEQQRVAADGIKLPSEIVENIGSGRKTDVDLEDGCGFVLELGQSLGSSDKEGKSKQQLEDVCGSAPVEESFIVASATIISSASETNQLHKSSPENGGREQGSEDKAGCYGVDEIIKPGSEGNGAMQQYEIPRGETSEVLSSGSTDASSLKWKKSDKDLKGEVENLCAVQTSQGGSLVVDSVNCEQQGHVSTADQSRNIVEVGRSSSGPATTSDVNPNLRSDVELKAEHEIIPLSSVTETNEVVSSKQTSPPDLSQKRSRSLNYRQGGKEDVWSSASVDDEAARDSTASRNAWVKANNEEEYDEYMKEYLSLKKSSSVPSSSRRQVESARRISTLGKASSLPEKKKRDDDDSDSGSEAVVPIRRKLLARNHTMDSVEEITARLSKKYNPTWAKVPVREGVGTSRPASALASIDMPKPIEPEIFAINSPKESLNSSVKKGIHSEKTDESAESYFSPMKKVFSAVRNVANKDKDGSGKIGHSQPPERKGLSAVLNIKRERFTSPLKRVLKSEAEGGKRTGSTNERKEKLGDTTTLAVLAEQEGGSTDRFKDRLFTPLKKVFSTEGNISAVGGKKPDIAQDVTPQGPPVPFRASPGQKQMPVRDEVAADGKFRERFILPLKKKFSSDSKEDRKKGDSALQTPDRSGPLTAHDASGGDGASTSDRIKSPDKKFSLSWTKKRAKDDQPAAPPQAQEEMIPGSIFEKPRSPGISEETTARLISHKKSNSTPPAVIDEAGYSIDDFRSPDTNFFWPLSTQQEKKDKEKGKETLQSSKEKAAGGKTSWWTRKRDKVVVEEATVAQAKQPTRDDARSSPERIIAGRSGDSAADRITAADRNSAASSAPVRHEKDEQQPFSVWSSPSEEIVSPALTHRREHSDSLPTRFRTHERRMSLSELSTPEKETTSAVRTTIFDQSIYMPERMSLFDQSNTLPHHARQRSVDMVNLRPEAHLYKSKSATGGADHVQERCRNEIVPFSGSRSDPEVNKLYRNLDSPSTSNAEIRITDKLKVPLEEVLSLLAAGDSSTRNSTAARESSSSSEETSSSEEEWSSSSDEDEADPAAVAVQKAIQPFQSRKSQHFFNKGNRHLRNVDA